MYQTLVKLKNYNITYFGETPLNCEESSVDYICYIDAPDLTSCKDKLDMLVKAKSIEDYENIYPVEEMKSGSLFQAVDKLPAIANIYKLCSANNSPYFYFAKSIKDIEFKSPLVDMHDYNELSLWTENCIFIP